MVLRCRSSFGCTHHHRDRSSFPTRRSSDLSSFGFTAIDSAADNMESASLMFAISTVPRSTTRSPCRSEEHTSELQSRPHLVCRLLLEKKKRPDAGCKLIVMEQPRVSQPDAP